MRRKIMIHTVGICRTSYFEREAIVHNLEHSGTYGVPLQAI